MTFSPATPIRLRRLSIQSCKHGIVNRISPLNNIFTPARINAGLYDFVISKRKPASGGPINDARPWNNKSRPNAFVSFSNPSRSTKMTEVKPT